MFKNYPTSTYAIQNFAEQLKVDSKYICGKSI